MQSKSIASVLQETVGCGTSSSKDEQPSAAFEELAIPLFDSLYNFAGWLVHDSNDAEDLVQETYLKALRSFASFQLGTNFRAWMFRILKNTFLSSISKLERRMTDARDLDEDRAELAVDTRTPETILVNRANTQLVQRAIDDLPAHHRETLLLRDVEEMSYQEIAEILSIPIGTVMSRLARARKAVRESLLCGRTDAPPGSHREAAPASGAHGDIGFEVIDQDHFGSAPSKPESGLFVSQEDGESSINRHCDTSGHRKSGSSWQPLPWRQL